jgi:hypothetical protein
MRNQHILLGRGRSVHKNDIFKTLQYQHQLNKNAQGVPQKKTMVELLNKSNLQKFKMKKI